MNEIKKKYLFVLLMLTGFFLAGHTSKAQTNTEKFDEKYNVIFQRNIFSKTRKADLRPKTNEDASKTEAVIKVRNIMYVLRGISIDKDNKWLYLEDDLDGGTYKLAIGQEFEGMTVKDIQFSSAVFTVGDREVTTGLGDNIAGSEVEVDRTETTKETDTTEAEETDSSSGTGDESDLLKQMMERRKRELGR